MGIEGFTGMDGFHRLFRDCSSNSQSVDFRPVKDLCVRVRVRDRIVGS